FFKTKKRFLRKDQKNNIIVSTVFLGLDHSFETGPPIFFETGPPILFESMAFDNGNELDCLRYATYNEAIEGHKELCHQYEIYFIGTKEDVINSIDDLQK
ncbi:MAG: hypothetical protein ACC656_15070, partial [Candidatus Heimdallarchaeota archaeon]